MSSSKVKGREVIEVVPDRIVAIIEEDSPFVKLNAKNPLNDDPYDYTSITLTKEQFLLVADRLR